MEKTANGTKSGWFMNNARWIYSNEEEGDGRSCLKGFVPAFESVKRRADPEYQRLKRLEAEDIFLRSILLAKDEASQLDIYNGDVTIL